MPADQDCTRGVRRLGSKAFTDWLAKATIGNVPVAGKAPGLVASDCSCPPSSPFSVTQPPPKVPDAAGVAQLWLTGLAKIEPSMPGLAVAMLRKLLKPSRV